MAYLAPPEEVRDAFDAVTRAQAGIRTREQEAAQEAEKRRREARARVYELGQSAAAHAHAQAAMARAEADAFRARLAQYRRLREQNPDVLTALWWDALGPLLGRMRAAGRLDVLDHYLGPDGLDIMQAGPRPKKP